jgi:hypothetical protein
MRMLANALLSHGAVSRIGNNHVHRLNLSTLQGISALTARVQALPNPVDTLSQLLGSIEAGLRFCSRFDGSTLSIDQWVCLVEQHSKHLLQRMMIAMVAIAWDRRTTRATLLSKPKRFSGANCLRK